MKSVILLSLALLTACDHTSRPEAKQEPTGPSAIKPQQVSNLSGWTRSESTNRLDGTKRALLVTFANQGMSGQLAIRCNSGKTEVFVWADQIIEESPVRIKLDDATPVRQSWSRAESYDALFAPNGAALARQLSKHNTFLIEVKPLDKLPEVLEFDLRGLDQNISYVAEACNWAAADRVKDQARAQAEQVTKALAELRKIVSFSVKPCSEFMGRWCWYDPNESFWRYGSAPKDTQKLAIDDALEKARANMAFKAEKASVEKEFSVKIPLPEYQ